MELAFLPPERHPEWNAFVDRSPQGSVYAKTHYLEAVGCRFRIAAVLERDEILGGILLATNEARVSSNPLFVKYLGVLHAPDLEDAHAVDRLLIEGARVRGVWSYAFHPAYDDWLPFHWQGFRQTTSYTHQIRFTGEPGFRSRYGEKVKGPLRAARKHGLAIADVSHAEVARLDRLSYEARGTRPPFSESRLVGLLDRLAAAGCVYAKGVRDAAGGLHAAAVVVHDRGSANLILDGSDRRQRAAGGNTLLVDHMIEFAQARCRLFDFEGSMHERIARFYRGFGGRLVPYSVIRAGNLPTSLYLLALGAYKRLRYS
jgi:hypothetical protein